MSDNFVFHAPTRLVFGSGSVAQAGAEAKGLGLSRLLVISGKGPTRESAGMKVLLASLEAAGVAVEVWAGAGHDPEAATIEAAASAAVETGAGGILAYGGGSPIDCAKGASLFAANALLPTAPGRGRGYLDYVYGRAVFSVPGLPLLAVPTTAGSGSEMSSAAVTTDPAARRKVGLSSAWFFPRVAIVDPAVQATMPASLTAATGMDALTHAIESYVSRRSTPLTRAIAGEAARAILANLARAVEAPSDGEARAAMALASSEVAAAFSQTGLGMVHGFAHPVGAIGGVAHGVANAVILPFVAAACAETDPAPFAALAHAAGLPVAGMAPPEAASALVAAISALSKRIGIPASLGALGFPRADLPAVLADALTYRNRAASPRAFTDAELGVLLERIY